MKKLIFLADFLFSLWLALVSSIAVYNGGRGVGAWPLIPLGIVMIVISMRRFWNRATHYIQAAVWHAAIVLLCAYGLLEEYSYAGELEFSVNLEVAAIGILSAVMLALNAYLHSKR